MIQDWCIHAAVIAALSLDATAVGQVMVSRPLVAGPLLGALAGEPLIGLLVGMLVEILWVRELPVGNYLPPDLTLLSGMGAVLAARLVGGGVPPEAALTYALAVAIPAAVFSSQGEMLVRRLNSRWVRFAQRLAESGHLRLFEIVLLPILGVQFLKGFLFAFVALVLAESAAGVFPLLPSGIVEGLTYAHWFLLALGCAAALELLVDRGALLYFLLPAIGMGAVVLATDVSKVLLLLLGVLVGFLLSLTGAPRRRLS